MLKNKVKPILHFQLAINANGRIIPGAETMGGFMKLVNQKLGNKYDIILSPCIPSVIGKNSKIYNFEIDEISILQLAEMLYK